MRLMGQGELIGTRGCASRHRRSHPTDDEFEDGDDTEEIELGSGNSGHAQVSWRRVTHFSGSLGISKIGRCRYF
jgi:hypothetical protein